MKSHDSHASSCLWCDRAAEKDGKNKSSSEIERALVPAVNFATPVQCLMENLRLPEWTAWFAEGRADGRASW